MEILTNLGIEAATKLSPNITVKTDISYDKRAGSIRKSPLTMIKNMM